MLPTFIETPLFAATAQFLSDVELRGIQIVIAANPDIGDTIRGTGGARKVRAKLAGRSKAPGARVIYVDNAACL